MGRVVLLLGGNLGDRAALMACAEAEVGRTVGRVMQSSSVYESEAWGFDSADRFLNRALVVETDLSPIEVLDRTQAIERALGRGPKAPDGEHGAAGQRVYRSRTMDIDLLFYDDLVVESERLTLPHPLLAEREFVLTPLREICGGWVHPVIGKKVSEL